MIEINSHGYFFTNTSLTNIIFEKYFLATAKSGYCMGENLADQLFCGNKSQFKYIVKGIFRNKRICSLFYYC